MFGSKEAVVLVKKNFNPEKEAETFLKEVFTETVRHMAREIENRKYDRYANAPGNYDKLYAYAAVSYTHLPIRRRVPTTAADIMKRNAGPACYRRHWERSIWSLRKA